MASLFFPRAKEVLLPAFIPWKAQPWEFTLFTTQPRLHCAACQSRVSYAHRKAVRRFPHYNDIHFIIISSYTFQGCTGVRYQTASHCALAGLTSPHSVRVWYVLYVALLTKPDPQMQLKAFLNETTVQTSSMLRCFK